MKKQLLIFGIIGFVSIGLLSCESSEAESSGQQDSKPTIEEDSSETISEEESEPVEPFDPAKVDLPEGYALFDSISGDLNGDGRNDYVFMVKGTDPEEWKENQFDETVDRNRRGLLIYLSEGVQANLAVENLDCFSSENEDGGVYFPPELDIEIRDGKFYVHYGHGRYGYWTYTFRYQQDKMKLIGYDNNVSRGPITEYEYSYNFLTGKKLVKKNINVDTEDYEAEEVFTETWSDLPKKELITLSSIEDFDELYFD